MSASDLKSQGNKFFAARKYDDAIGCYTKAIVSENPIMHFLDSYYIFF